MAFSFNLDDDTLTANGINYNIPNLSTNLVFLANRHLAVLYPASQPREILTVALDDSPLLNKHVKILQDNCRTYPDNLEYITNYVNTVIFPNNDETKITAIIRALEATNQTRALLHETPLDEFIAAKTGSYRHKVLVTAVLLSKLIENQRIEDQQHSLLTFPSDSVRILIENNQDNLETHMAILYTYDSLKTEADNSLSRNMLFIDLTLPEKQCYTITKESELTQLKSAYQACHTPPVFDNFFKFFNEILNPNSEQVKGYSNEARQNEYFMEYVSKTIGECPISQDLITTPARVCLAKNEYSHAYEEEQITKWVAQSNLDPLTRRKLASKDIIADQNTKESIAYLLYLRFSAAKTPPIAPSPITIATLRVIYNSNSSWYDLNRYLLFCNTTVAQAISNMKIQAQNNPDSASALTLTELEQSHPLSIINS